MIQGARRCRGPATAAGTTRGSPSLTLRATSRSNAPTPTSTLHFTRDLIALRRRLESLHTGAYTELPAPVGSWAWRRGDDVIVALNLGAVPVALSGIDGTIALSTSRSRDGEHVDGNLALAPSEGAIVSGG